MTFAAILRHDKLFFDPRRDQPSEAGQ